MFKCINYSILLRTVMSWHYYCWALGYSNDQEFDPVLRVMCDDVRIYYKKGYL